jgi:hypothetical protein
MLTYADVCMQLLDAEASADPLHRGSVTMRLYGVTQDGMSVLVRMLPESGPTPADVC